MTFKFNWANAAGTLLLVAGLITMLALRVSPGRALRVFGRSLDQLKWATLTVAAVLALAYVMNFSGQTITLGLWIAGAGGILAFLSSIIGWLGVAVTGSDTSSNSLFGALQVSAAKEAGLDQTLLAAANSSGGVLGKMISPQNLAIGAAAVGHGRARGRALPARAWMEHRPAPDHVRARVPPVDAGPLVDGRLAARLRDIVGGDWCYTAEHQLRTYESDGLLQYSALPAVAVLPGSAEQVQACVKACADAGVPWVARGSGSGLSGGALPVADGVLIVTSRMKRVLEVDLANQRVCVEPGVTNIAVSSAVAPDFFYPPDPSSQIVCSIGGNVAENSGGAHCFKYGFTTNYVCGLEVVLPDGELVVLGGRELDPPGYDLLGAFVGSEGTLGIATKVWLRVMPAPETVKTLVAFFDSTHAAGEAVSEIVQSGVVPGAIEMMDRVAIEASEQMAHAGYPVGRGAALLVELDGAERECEARFEQVVALCERCGSDDVRVARDEAERQLFWKTRKAAFPAMGRISPNYFVQDGVIPRTKLPEVLEAIDALAEEYGMVVANVFHAGDGNLHPLVCFDGRNAGEAERAEELSGRILDACLEAGGSITGEHGVGVDKKKHMPKMFGEPDLDAFQRLRCSFDPRGLANPGKVMPTPRLCGEVPGIYRQHPLEAAGLAERF